MGLVAAKLWETATHVLAMLVLVLNLRKIQCALLQVFPALLEIWMSHRDLAFVQWTLNSSGKNRRFLKRADLAIEKKPSRLGVSS